MTSHSSKASPKMGVKRSPESSSDRENGQWTGEDSDLEGSHPDISRKRLKNEHDPDRPMSVSCETCKLRKVKCDRGQPSCSWCLKNRQICEYKERKKPGLRAGYGRELEAKLAEQAKVLNRIQEMLLRHESAIAQLSSKTIPTAPSPRSTEGSIAHVALDAQSRTDLGKELAPLPSISSYIPGFKPNTNSHGNSPDIKGSQAITLQGEPTALNKFPDQELCRTLCELYFKHINSWFPILHKDFTTRKLFKCPPSQLEASEQVLLHAIVATSLRFAKDRRLSSEDKLRQHQHSTERVQLYCLRNTSIEATQALLILTLDLIGGQNEPMAYNTTNLLTKSAVQLGLTREPKSLRVGDLKRIVRSPAGTELPEPRDFIEAETQRRLIWAIYALDRYSTFATSLEVSLTSDIDRMLPCHDDYFLMNQHIETPWLQTNAVNNYSGARSLGTFSHLIELVEILSRIHDFSRTSIEVNNHDDVTNWRSQFEKLEGILCAWWYRLPMHYRNTSHIELYSRNDVVDQDLVFLQATYFTALIRLNSCNAYQIQTSTLFKPPTDSIAIELCTNAAESIVRLLSLANSRDLLFKTGPFFGVCLWTAARVLLINSMTSLHRSAQSSPTAHRQTFGSPSSSQPATPTHHTTLRRDQSTFLAVDGQINEILNGLRALSECWPMASRYADLLYRSIQALQSADAPEVIMVLKDMNRNISDIEAIILRRHVTQAHSSEKSPVRYARSSGDAKTSTTDREYLNDLDPFGNPRLPTGFDRIIDTASNSRSDRSDLDHQRGLSSHPRYPVLQNERQADWVSQRMDTQ